MSDANRTNLSYFKEGTYAAAPTGSDSHKELRFLSANLVHDKITERSEEIRDDRSVGEIIQVGVGANGTIGTEFIFGEYEPFLIEAFQANTNTTSNDAVTVTVSGQTMTATAGTFSANTQGARFVKIANAVTVGNNGIKKVVSCTGTVLTLEAGSLTGSDTGDAINVSSVYIRNGTTLNSYALQEHFLTIPRYVLYKGMCVNEFNLTMEARKRALASWGFLGNSAIESGTIHGDGTLTAPTSYPIMNTTSNIGAISEAGVALSDSLLSLGLKVNNGLRERLALARPGTLKCGSGTCAITVAARAYFSSAALLTKFLAHTSTSLEFHLKDASGNVVNFFLPQVELTSNRNDITGINSDVFLDLEFGAEKDTTKGYMIQVDYLSA